MRSSTGSCGSAWTLGALLAGAARTILGRAVEAARAVVDRHGRGTACRPRRGGAGTGARLAGLVRPRTACRLPRHAGGRASCRRLRSAARTIVAVAAAEGLGRRLRRAGGRACRRSRLRKGLSPLSRRRLRGGAVARRGSGAEGRCRRLAGLAEGPVTGSAAAVGASSQDGPCDYRRCCRSWEPDSRGVREKRGLEHRTQRATLLGTIRCPIPNCASSERTRATSRALDPHDAQEESVLDG